MKTKNLKVKFNFVSICTCIVSIVFLNSTCLKAQCFTAASVTENITNPYSIGGVINTGNDSRTAPGVNDMQVNV